MRSLWTGVALLVVISAWYDVGRTQPRTDTVVPPAPARHLVFGNPSHATTNPSDADNFLLAKPQFVLSYHNTHGTPNWVSWHLKKSDIGKVERQDTFRPDPELPRQFKHVLPNDYVGSGFDRGHMCNSKDRTQTEADNSATFVMTNMVPQTPDLNRGPWEKLESYARTLVGSGRELSMIAGCSGARTTLRRANTVQVPESCWKVIAVLPRGGNTVAHVESNTRVIAVEMPNTQGIKKKDWRAFLTTARAIEAKTGYDFFSTVPTEIQDQIETRKDTGRARATRTSTRERRRP